MKQSIQFPEGNVLLRNFQWQYPLISHGKGMYLWDKNKKKYIDASGSAFVNCLGHGVDEVVSKIQQQISNVAYINGNYFSSDAMEELASKLISVAPDGFGKVGLLGSGSEAVEAAIKFCRQCAFEEGHEKRTKLIARKPGYHGNTLYALSASARPRYKKSYAPLLHEIPMCAAPYPLYCPVDYEEKGADYYFKDLEQLIIREDPRTIFALILEPMPASSCGAAPPPKGYLKRVEQLCRKNGIRIIADEVACGAGRTGSYFASVEFDLNPDVIVLGKSLNGGYVPCSAILVKNDDLKILAKNSGSFMHAQTYMHSPVFAACALAVYDYIQDNKLLENVAKRGAELKTKLTERLASHKNVAPITGHGLMLGVEFIEQKESLTPFPYFEKTIERFTSFAFEKGLVVFPNKGQAPNGDGDLFVLAPPFNITAKEVDEIADLTVESIEEFFAK